MITRSNIAPMKLALNHDIIGDNTKPPFIILHGLFGSISNWRSVAKMLSEHYCIHSLDLRNHGNSPWADTMSYVEMATDVHQYIIDHDLDQPYLLGHSMGGKVCMVLLQYFAPQLSKVFIIDIAPVQYDHNHDHFIEALLALNIKYIISRKQIDNDLSKSITSLSVRQFLLQNLIRKDEGFQWRLNLPAIARAKQEIFGYPDGIQCDKPITLIKGSHSDYIIADYYDQIFSHFPKTRLTTIENAGHWLHAEQPQQLVDLILQQG